MNLKTIALGLVIAGASPCAAKTDRNIEGYLHCSLQHLDACDNSSQLVNGLRDHSYSHFFEKKKTTNAIQGFLQRAPTIDSRVTAGNDAVFAFWGPGDAPYHFASGEWFFDGFTPHAAPYGAAIIFDASGKILLVAIHDGSGGMLRIFVHRPEPRSELVEHVLDWAKKRGNLSSTEFITASVDLRTWEMRQLP